MEIVFYHQQAARDRTTTWHNYNYVMLEAKTVET